MLLTTAINRIKIGTHDAINEYTNDVCVDYLNTAIMQIGSLLVSAKYPPIAKSKVFTNNEELPQNFMVTCGTYPIKIEDNKIVFLDDVTSLKVKYFSLPELMTNSTVNLPFKHDAVNEVVVKLAIQLALNDNEFDISQDTNLSNALQQAIAGGFGYGS